MFFPFISLAVWSLSYIVIIVLIEESIVFTYNLALYSRVLTRVILLYDTDVFPFLSFFSFLFFFFLFHLGRDGMGWGFYYYFYIMHIDTLCFALFYFYSR